MGYLTELSIAGGNQGSAVESLSGSDQDCCSPVFPRIGSKAQILCPLLLTDTPSICPQTFNECPMPRPRSGSESRLCLSLAVQSGAPSLSLCLSFLIYKGGMVTSICRVTGKCPAYCKRSINGSCHQSLRREEVCRLWEVLKTPGCPSCCPINLGHPASGTCSCARRQQVPVEMQVP